MPAGRGANLSHQFAAGVLALLMGLQPVTTDLMLPALPALAGDLQAPMAAVQLTMSALILAFGLTQLVWGPVADRFGRRPVLLIGLSMYTLASLAAALGATVAAVVVARALQGAGLASALAGFVTAALAFGIGLWLGRALAPAHSAVAPFALGMATAALAAVVVAWTLVRRHGELNPAA